MIKSFIFNHMIIYYYTFSNTKFPELLFTYNMFDMRGKFEKNNKTLHALHFIPCLVFFSLEIT